MDGAVQKVKYWINVAGLRGLTGDSEKARSGSVNTDRVIWLIERTILPVKEQALGFRSFALRS